MARLSASGNSEQQILPRGLGHTGEPCAVRDVALERAVMTRLVARLVGDSVRHQDRNRVVIANHQLRSV